MMLSVPITVFAAEENNTDEIYSEQLAISGAGELFSSLPKETQDMLTDMGINSLNYDSVTTVDPSRIFGKVVSLVSSKGSTPLGAGAVCLGIMILCSLTEGANMTLGENSIGKVSSVVGALCVCTAAVVPMCEVIARSVEIINGASGFMLLYVPIMTGLMVSSGHEATAASFYTMLMGAAQLISQLSSKLLTPVLNTFLALSLTSSLSPKLNLSVLCSSLYKCTKWLLTLVMSIFATVLSAQSFVTSSLDKVSQRALRFAVSSFVPVVGGVLSETITTFSGSLELLKSGTGVFVIIASACLFLPVLTECILWQVSLSVLSSASDILGLSRMKSVYSAVSSAAAMLTAILLCILTVFIISTVIILLTGR